MDEKTEVQGIKQQECKKDCQTTLFLISFHYIKRQQQIRNLEKCILGLTEVNKSVLKNKYKEQVTKLSCEYIKFQKMLRFLTNIIKTPLKISAHLLQMDLGTTCGILERTNNLDTYILNLNAGSFIHYTQGLEKVAFTYQSQIAGIYIVVLFHILQVHK